MIINFSQSLIDIRDNKPIYIDIPQKGTKDLIEIPLTLLKVSSDALCNIEVQDNPEDKYKFAKLLDRLYANPSECELSIEELAIIKQRISKFYGPLVLLAVDKILEK